MSSPEKYFLTTPIYYVNARPHIGHAYSTIVGDVIARRHRLLGDDTFFLTGTDEHGQKIERSAQAAGIDPQTFTDQVSAEFRGLWQRMGITNDDFIRTTEPRHKRGAQKLFADLYERGAIYLSTYTGQYCVSEEIFVEGPPGVIGPDGKPTETVTEENFFFRLSDYQLRLLDLIESDGLRITPESRKNEVLSFLRGNVSEAREQGRAVALSAAGEAYVPGNLRDLSVSRSSFTWGIPVPEPAASATQQKHVIYVWLDALANYMTAVGYGAGTAEGDAQFARYWPADVHIMAKEITRQHCIYWPAFLMAAELPLPKAVTAHGWLLFDNAKMSKSKGNIVRTETILDAFGDEVYGRQFPDSSKSERDLFAADVLRYFLLREVPFGQDGSFSFEAMITRYNADLANGYGNLVSRTLSMIALYFDGEIPVVEQYAETTIILDRGQPLLGFRAGLPHPGQFLKVPSAELAAASVAATFFADDSYSEFLFSLATNDTNIKSSRGVIDWTSLLVSETDGFITKRQPWKLAKSTDPSDRALIADTLYQAVESARIITALLYPILPNATAKVWAQLGLGDIEEAAKNGQLTNLKWGGLKPGTKLGPLTPIFPRADKGLAQIMSDMEIQKDMQKVEGDRSRSLLDDNKGADNGNDSSRFPAGMTNVGVEAEGNGSLPPVPADSSPEITIDDFAKVELRVAQVVVAERIPKADKLLRLEVDLGYEKRQILSGIAEWYTPEDLIGRRIVVITNLAPRKMRGLESHGMLLAASGPEGGKPALATFEAGDSLPLGSRLK